MEDYGGNSSDNDMKSSSSCPRGHWRPAEDEKLRKLVEQYGPQNWNSIAEKLQGRSGKSCRLRWFNQLDPRINRKPFTEEEEEKLLAAHRVHGNKWALISRLFPGRTDNAVKNHWHVVMARMQRERLKQHQNHQQSNGKRSVIGLIPSNNKSSSNDSLFSSKPSSLKYQNDYTTPMSDLVGFNFTKDKTVISSTNPSPISSCWSFSSHMEKYKAIPPASSFSSPSIFGKWTDNRYLSPTRGSSNLLEMGQYGSTRFSSNGFKYYQDRNKIGFSSNNIMRRSSPFRSSEEDDELSKNGEETTNPRKEIQFIDFLGVGNSNSRSI